MMASLPFPVGVWTYRSFYNRPDQAAKLGELLLAEGEMVFEAGDASSARGQLAFRSKVPKRTDARLELRGSVEAGAPAVVRFRGIGDFATSAKGWVYDYVGYLVPEWPGGIGQQAAIVGSVTRAKAHPGVGGKTEPAGQVFSFIAVKQDFLESRDVIPIPKSILEMLASRQHRLYHLVWHTVRNNWNDPDTIPGKIKPEIDKLHWAPPRPVLSAAGDPLPGNGSGEDFLFMHRQMLLAVNKGLATPIPRWATIPAPGLLVIEPDFSAHPVHLPPPGNPAGYNVPDAWVVPGDDVTTQRLASLKSAEFYWSRMLWWDRRYKDPAYLASLSLGELGTLLEWTVHNDMHMRWASIPRNPDDQTPLPSGRPDGDIHRMWDKPIYDHLGDQYSSHVNPVFWRLHGWVDDRIEDWFAARTVAHPDSLERIEVMGVPWFKGAGVAVGMPWTGPMDMAQMMSTMTHSSSKDIKDMERVIELIFPKQQRKNPMAKVPLHPIAGTRYRSRF
jgi:hypothetical protein